jgi:hypothetical protein
VVLLYVRHFLDGGKVLIMKKLLWLDDFRRPEDFIKTGGNLDGSGNLDGGGGNGKVCAEYDITWVKNYEEFCKYINANGLPDIICFDHDLGEEKSGYDCAKFVVTYCQAHQLDIPEFEIQSSNVVGKENIRGVLNGWHRVFVGEK